MVQDYGTEGLIYNAAIAAAAVGNIYFPLGSQDLIPGDVPGLYRDAVLKEIIVACDDEVVVLGIGYHASDGTEHYTIGNGTEYFYVPHGGSMNPLHIKINQKLRDIDNVFIRIANLDGVNAQNYSIMVLYVPIR